MDLGLIFNPFGVAIVAIVGGIISGIFATAAKARVREMEIRERIAMIERGLVPSPETDPNGFERRMQSLDRISDVAHYRYHRNRFRSAGIVVMSVGFGLITLLWFVGVEREALGIGGFLVILGLGLFVNGLFVRPLRLPPSPPSPPQPPQQPSQS